MTMECVGLGPSPVTDPLSEKCALPRDMPALLALMALALMASELLLGSTPERDYYKKKPHCETNQAFCVLRLRGINRIYLQYVCISPFPLATIFSSRGVNQCSLRFFRRHSAVLSDTWIRPGTPLASIRAAVLTVSPKSWKRAFFPRKTPAVT